MKRIATLFMLTGLLFCACGNPAKKYAGEYEYAFQNPYLPVEERIDNLLFMLTLEEKVGLMLNTSAEIERFGIPAYNWWGEACHGIIATGVTVFPQSIGMAATFNEDRVEQVFTAVSDEARARYNTMPRNFAVGVQHHAATHDPGLSFFVPNVNIFRDPRWGRGQETYGEDPYLSGLLGSAVVRGMQGDDDKYYKVHACAKHYAVHSGPEPLRHQFDVTVSGRDLWESYLPAFHSLVRANVQEVMCAYNAYQGTPCCASETLLVDILRQKWGYDDIIVTDCSAINNFYRAGQHETHPDAVTASVAAVLAGTDLECGSAYRTLVEGAEKGLITEEDINVSLRRILRGWFELGMLDQEDMTPWANLGAEVIWSRKHQDLALETARESMTLLKNDGVLPLSKEIKTIAVIGPNADDSTVMWGNYHGFPVKTVSLIDGIRAKLPDANIIYDKGCDLVDTVATQNQLVHVTGNNRRGMYAEYFDNMQLQGTPVTANNVDRMSFSTNDDFLFAPGAPRNNFSARYSGVYKAPFTGTVYMKISGGDDYKLTVDGKVLAEYSQAALAAARQNAQNQGIPQNILVQMMRTNEPMEMKVVEGRTYNIQIEYAKGASGNASFNFELYRRQPLDFTALAEKVKEADVILFAGGLSAKLEGENMRVNFEGFNGGDRTTIELPRVQQQTLAALKATGKPVVLVNCSGSAIAFGNIENQYNALLQAWYGGQSGGTAIADVLFGDYNPAGRLPVTFYQSNDQLPHFEDYNMDGRTYRYMTEEPLYAFGYGLSYTTFGYGDAKLSRSSVRAGRQVGITIPVTNTGRLAGQEVVQVYVKSLDNPDAPIKSLKAFQRVSIPAGQTERVRLTLGPEAFEYYDASIEDLAVLPGKYRILYGGSSRDADLKAIDFEVK